MFASLLTSRKNIAAGLLAGAVLLTTGAAGFGQQQYVPTYSNSPAPPVQPYVNQQAQLTAADQLDQLLAAITLCSIRIRCLPRCWRLRPIRRTSPAPAQWLQTYPNPTDDDINAQPWDPSVKAAWCISQAC